MLAGARGPVGEYPIGDLGPALRNQTRSTHMARTTTDAASQDGSSTGGAGGPGFTRREFVAATAGLAAAGLAGFGPVAGLIAPSAYAASASGAGKLKVGVIGCGGRGTGAVIDLLTASADAELYAMGDVFPDRLEGSVSELEKVDGEMGARARVPAERRFTGFDAYKQVIATGPDIVILATPPHFRPMHLAAAVERGCHVFMEKPVATDPAGVRSVLASARVAQEKKLSIVTGTQRRHERCYLEAMKRLQDGAIGRVVSARCYWNQGGLWMHKRQPAWSDMEWQLRNWLYFAWLSGDHIVEQHVHNIDATQWAVGSVPTRCSALGGRQSRTGAEYGHVFDHFAVEYEHADGVVVQSFCRQIDGTPSRVEEVIVGTEGVMLTSSGRAEIRGKNPWKFTGENPNPYVEEHRDLVAAITSGQPLNEAKRIAESTLSAIMGRMSAYTGKDVTWRQAMESKLDLAPPSYAFGDLPVPPVAIPGRTPLV